MRIVLLMTTGLMLMSSNALAEEMQTSGICGATAEDCSWNYEDGKLTITGNGEMSDFETSDNQPWYHLKNDVTEIDMSGITTVGDRAFSNFRKVENITIPPSVKILGTNSLVYMTNLASVAFEEGSELAQLDWGVFAYDSKLNTLEIPETVKYISAFEVYETGVTSLVLPKGVFEKGGKIDYRALQSNMTIYCPKEYQAKCEDYLETAQESTGNRDAEGNKIYAPVTNMTLQTYEKDGDAYFINGSWYQHPNDVLTGKHIKKLRYTVEEAMKATENGDKFHVRLTYK